MRRRRLIATFVVVVPVILLWIAQRLWHLEGWLLEVVGSALAIFWLLLALWMILKPKAERDRDTAEQ